jgi:hypothetical protein
MNNTNNKRYAQRRKKIKNPTVVKRLCKTNVCGQMGYSRIYDERWRQWSWSDLQQPIDCLILWWFLEISLVSSHVTKNIFGPFTMKVLVINCFKKRLHIFQGMWKMHRSQTMKWPLLPVLTITGVLLIVIIIFNAA